MLNEITSAMELVQSGAFRRWLGLVLAMSLAAGCGWGFALGLLLAQVMG